MGMIGRMIMEGKGKDYNVNGWGIEALKVRDGGGEDVEIELISRKDTQRQ